MNVTIGLTRSDREGPAATGYSSFGEGYLPGASQDTFEVDIPDQMDLPEGAEVRGLELLGWIVLKATNDPTAEWSPGTVGRVARSIAGLRRTRMRSFSTGDTLTVAGKSVALTSDGFVPVEITAPDPAVLAASVEEFWAARLATLVGAGPQARRRPVRLPWPVPRCRR
jgi:hypothetical protein